MNKDQIKGGVKQVAGEAQSQFGKATGNKTSELKGEFKKAAGKVQSTYGNAKDEADL